VFKELLQQLNAERSQSTRNIFPNSDEDLVARVHIPVGHPITEVSEVIEIQAYGKHQHHDNFLVSNVDLGEDVEAQLRDFILTIAQLYRYNPFHNFEHASRHVNIEIIGSNPFPSIRIYG
jgi:hypothetical protein